MGWPELARYFGGRGHEVSSPNKSGSIGSARIGMQPIRVRAGPARIFFLNF